MNALQEVKSSKSSNKSRNGSVQSRNSSLKSRESSDKSSKNSFRSIICRDIIPNKLAISFSAVFITKVEQKFHAHTCNVERKFQFLKGFYSNHSLIVKND